MSSPINHYNICRSCISVKMNPQTGFYCGLTGTKPGFSKNCDSYGRNDTFLEIESLRPDERGNYLMLFLHDYRQLAFLYTGIFLIATLLGQLMNEHAYSLGEMAGFGVVYSIIYFKVKKDRNIIDKGRKQFHYALGLLAFSILLNALAVGVLYFFLPAQHTYARREAFSSLVGYFLLIKPVLLMVLGYVLVRTFKKWERMRDFWT
jgi:hypothetical protein